MLRNGELDNQDIEIEISPKSQSPLKSMDIPGMPGGMMGMINLGDLLGKGFGKQKRKENYLLRSHTKFC